MSLSEVVFKVTHDCPFGNISRRFPFLKMFLWCNREYEVLEMIVKEPEAYSVLMEELSKIGGIIQESSDTNTVHLVTKKCFCTLENSVAKNIDECSLLHVSPVVYERGWEYYRVIAFRHEDLKRFLERLEEIAFSFEVLRKVPFDGFIASSLTLTADALFSDLTEKQMDALLSAYSHGYYMLPRKADIKTIADRKGVARTTFQEHLKKAENKLVSSLVPYIQLFRQASADRRIRIRMKQRI